MKTTMTALALLLLSISSLSAQVKVVNVDGRPVAINTGAICGLTLHGLSRVGQCSIGHVSGSKMSLIKVGDSFYRIDRVQKGLARFTHVEPLGEGKRFLGYVAASGSCWIGDGIKFCAE